MTIAQTIAWMIRNRAGSPRKSLQCALAAAVLASTGLAGCESGATLASNPPETSVAPVAPKLKTVAVYPVLAAPDPLNKQIQTGVADAIDKSKFRVITVADGSTPPADYQLRGYGTASKDKTAAKFSYFFDVLDAQGQKVNRLAGEEPLPKPGAKVKDLWPSVTPEIIKAAATKTATSFAASVAGAPSPSGLNPAPSPQTSGPQTPGSASPATPPPAAANVTPIAANAPLAPQPATVTATPSGPLTVAVLPVTGAPGDGDKALTAALKSELKRKGFSVVEGSAPSAYKVQGQVTATPNDQGQEAVKIAWDVKDGNGNRMATVSQGNTVEKGALSGAWGPTANDVATAASVQIDELIRSRSGAGTGGSAPTPVGKQASVAAPVR
ncbi:MAG: hypothetical protein SH859_13385 [Hyphomicrobium aestuarii]|nr:hypothetical protein [Hyphomicrobium aestuarii]